MPSARAAAMRAKTVSSFDQLRGPCVLRCAICSGHPAPRATAMDSSMDSMSVSSSLRMCVLYGRRRRASGLLSAISSASGANAPGVYSSPLDAPQAPSTSERSTSATIRSSSAAVAGRFSLPITAPRTVPSPTMDATLTAGGSWSTESKKARSESRSLSSSAIARGPRDDPSCPTTTVVTP